MKTIDVIKAYKHINNAKLTKMDDADKFKVIKAIRVLKPIYNAYEDFLKDAQERLKGENHEEMEKAAREWNEKNAGRTDLSNDELERLNEINSYFRSYNRSVEECAKEESEKEHEMTYEKLSEEAFGKFIASNDFTVDEIMSLQDVLC